MNENFSTKKILKRLLNTYVKKHYKKILISIVCMVLVAAAPALTAKIELTTDQKHHIASAIDKLDPIVIDLMLKK